MTQNAPESAGNIVKFQISSNFTDYAVDCQRVWLTFATMKMS